MTAPIATGFDPDWTSATDYILGTTHEIWETNRVAALTEYCAEDLIVRSPAAVIQGQSGIAAAALATLAEFPDRVVLGEDVLWTATSRKESDGRTGFLASHRMTSLATHSGAGVFGAATGQRVRFRVIADSWCAENRVQDEWLVRDQSAVARQLGLDPMEWTRDLIAREGGPEQCAAPLSPDTDIDGPYGGRGTDDPVSDRLADILKRIMNGELATITTEFDRSVETAYAGGVESIGRDSVGRFWIGLRSAFPSAGFRIEHRIGMEEDQFPPRAAIRWSLYGRHDGFGIFGAPTGAYVYVMGITHAEFGPRGLRREWTLIDETAIWKQILMAAG